MGRNAVWLFQSREGSAAVKFHDLQTADSAERCRVETAALGVLTRHRKHFRGWSTVIDVVEEAGVVVTTVPSDQNAWRDAHRLVRADEAVDVATGVGTMLGILHTRVDAESWPTVGIADAFSEDLPAPAQLLLRQVLANTPFEAKVPDDDAGSSLDNLCLHGDVRLSNILQHAAPGEYSLVDFETARLGPAERDVGQLLQEFLAAAVRAGTNAEIILGPFHTTLIRTYERVTGHRLDASAVVRCCLDAIVVASFEYERGRERLSRQTLQLLELGLQLSSATRT